MGSNHKCRPLAFSLAYLEPQTIRQIYMTYVKSHSCVYLVSFHTHHVMAEITTVPLNDNISVPVRFRHFVLRLHFSRLFLCHFRQSVIFVIISGCWYGRVCYFRGEPHEIWLSSSPLLFWVLLLLLLCFTRRQDPIILHEGRRNSQESGGRVLRGMLNYVRCM